LSSNLANYHKTELLLQLTIRWMPLLFTSVADCGGWSRHHCLITTDLCLVPHTSLQWQVVSVFLRTSLENPFLNF